MNNEEITKEQKKYHQLLANKAVKRIPLSKNKTRTIRTFLKHLALSI